MPRQAKHALILLAVGVWLLSRGVFPAAWILLAVAAVVGSKWYRDPRRLARTGASAAAARHGLLVPDEPWIWSALEQVERRRVASVRAAPALAADFDDVVASMWLELGRGPQTTVAWRDVLTKVLREWPAPSSGEAGKAAGFAGPLEESLARLRRASKLWQEARREATT
jgi:hypothetical protein